MSCGASWQGCSSAKADPRTTATLAGRHDDSARRRDRVLAAIATAVTAGDDLSAAIIARRAGVDRTFLYRHRDQLEHLHTVAAQPPHTTRTGPTVSRESLRADLLTAQQRCQRLAARNQQLENACPNYSANKPGT